MIQLNNAGVIPFLYCLLGCLVFSASPVFYLMNIKTVWSVCGGYFLLSLGLAIFGSCLPGVMVRQVLTLARPAALFADT